MTNKTIMIGLVAVAFVAGSIMTGTMAYAAPNGQPFQALFDAIDDLQNQIDELDAPSSPEIKHFTTTETGVSHTIVDSDVTPESVISLSVDEVPGGVSVGIPAGCSSASVEEGKFTVSCFLDELPSGSTFNYFVTNP